MSDGVIVTVKLSVIPERLEELVAMLAAMFPVTQQKKGFRNIRLMKSEIKSNSILLLEEWDTAQDFHAYNEFRVGTGEMAIKSEMTDSPPQIGIWDRSALAEAGS